MGGSGDMEEICPKLGPWGGLGGTEWSYKPKGSITEIVILHGWAIDSISFKSDNGNGSAEYSQKYGGEGGKTDKVLLDFPREYLTSISGTFDSAWPFGPVVIKSLHFHTNRTRYGPFGRETGQPFSLPMEAGAIVGFHGRASGFIDSIGVHIEPFAAFSSPTEVSNVMDLVLPRDPGPWGGTGGKIWDDGIFSGVYKVNVLVLGVIVRGIQIMYRKRNGEIYLSERRGGFGGKSHRIILQNPSEYLVGIAGFVGKIEENDGFEVLRSLTFYTNKGKYGPFGDEIGREFTSGAMGSGMIAGFHGKSGAYLDAIGLHMEYF
ncbi:hypothetical protein SLE2022_099800 [Rubroshorea leprosula]